MTGHEPTRRGGIRRTGIAQKTDQGTSAAARSRTDGGNASETLGKSTSRINWRRVVRIPHPVHFHLGENLGLPECPYVRRWRIEFPFGSIRVHHWLAPDDDRARHDHPWWFLTFVIKGGYTDAGERLSQTEHLRAPCVRFRPALHRHTVFPDPGGAWTLLITGRPLRKWGFYSAGKFIKANKWFLSYGHHPCDSGDS